MISEFEVIGNIGQAPDFQKTPSGSDYCNFSVASNKKVGEETRTSWFNIKAWSPSKYYDYIKPGDLVRVRGEIEVVKKEDQTFYNFTARDIKILKSKDDGGNGGGRGRGSNDRYRQDSYGDDRQRSSGGNDRRGGGRESSHDNRNRNRSQERW